MSSDLDTNEGFVPPERRWPFLFLASLLVSLLGVLNVIYGGEQYWLGLTALGFFFPGVPIAIIQMYKPKPVSQHKHGFVVKKSPWAAISYLILCTGWLLASLYVGIHRPETGPIIQVLVLICSVGIVVALWQFFDPRPLMVINDKGFFDRTLHVGTIPWSQVLGAEIASVEGTSVIALKVKDQSLLEPRRSTLQRVHQKLEQLVGFELLHLGFVQLDAQYVDEALDFILSRCEQIEVDGDLDALLRLGASQGNTQTQ